MKIYTIGFTKKSAQDFFTLIQKSKTSKLIDVRLNTTSQLAGFAKKDDLKFFLKEICGVEYIHLPDLTPTKDILGKYQKKEISWKQYEDSFMNLMAKRNIERIIKAEELDNGCLLCSEHEPHFCHRRLVIEYLNTHKNFDLKPLHLL